MYLGVDFKQTVDFLPSPYAAKSISLPNNLPVKIKNKDTRIISFYYITQYVFKH